VTRVVEERFSRFGPGGHTESGHVLEPVQRNARNEFGERIILKNWYLGYFPDQARSRFELLLDRGADATGPKDAKIPMLVRASTAVFGDSLVALRLPAIACAVTTVVLVALLARELGGGTRAQVFAAVGVSSSFLLLAGHVFLTASPDMVTWTLTILFAARALLRDEPRWWLAAGVTVGVSLYNKQLVVLLLIGLAVGLLIAGPRRHLASGRLWAGVALAVAIAAPTLLYQATNGWPELHMAHTIAVDKGPDDRVNYVPFQLLLLGPPLDADTVALVVGLDRSDVADAFATCQQVGTLDNGVGVDNEEQGRPIMVCRGTTAPWSTLWPTFQHYG
jgi:hypothetical protein